MIQKRVLTTYYIKNLHQQERKAKYKYKSVNCPDIVNTISLTLKFLGAMFSFIDQKKFYQLGVGMLGVMSVYLIYGIIYERSISQHYDNSETEQKQIFKSQFGFVFLQQLFAWLLVEVFAYLSNSKQSIVQIPKRFNFICGLLASFSSVLFTYGIFELSFISSMLQKNYSYFFVTLLSFLFGSKISKYRNSKRIDFILSKVILMGGLIFWIYSDQTWFFSENKSGHLYAYLIVLSAVLDCFLAYSQSWICQKYQPTEIHLLHNVSSWTLLCSLVILIMSGDLVYTIKFFFTHYDFAWTILGLSALYFVGQFFFYRITVKMVTSAPLFIFSSKNILLIHESYALSRHKFNRYQLLGMAISWLCILFQAFILVRRQEGQKLESLQVQIFEQKKGAPKQRHSIRPI